MFSIILLSFLLLAFISPSHADTNIINVYDANGNLVTGDGNYYEYNEANQLVKVRQGDQNGAVIAEYFYDYSGQRIKKIENGVTTYYVGPHFEKQVGGADAGDSKYYFADGERVAKKDPAGNVYYYHSDHLGGVNAVTDSAGNVVAKTEYLPFGDVRTGNTGNEKYSYTGKEKDKTDLYYFESRYNSPMFRHFTQADVASPDLSDPQDLNRYSYVGNNPLSYVDYDGHKKKKKSKKKAKLSKREKWMIAHGVDPDHDKTSLKKAKKQFKEGKKYITASKSKTSTASSSKYNLAGGGTGGGGYQNNSSYGISREDGLNGIQTVGGRLGAYSMKEGLKFAIKKSAPKAFGRIGSLYGTLASNSISFAGVGVDAYMDTYEHPERDNVEAMARFSIDMTLNAITGITTLVATPAAGFAVGAAFSANRENIQEIIMHNEVTDTVGGVLYKLGWY